MQYTLSLNARMLTLAGLCLLSLFILLFLLGVEMGKKIAATEVETAIAATTSSASALISVRETPLESTVKLKYDDAK